MGVFRAFTVSYVKFTRLFWFRKQLEIDSPGQNEGKTRIMAVNDSCAVVSWLNEEGECKWYSMQDASLIGGATLDTDFLEWHLSQSEAVERFHNKLCRKPDLRSCWQKTASQHGWNSLKHFNVLKSDSSLIGFWFVASQRKIFSTGVTAVVESKYLFYSIAKALLGLYGYCR